MKGVILETLCEYDAGARRIVDMFGLPIKCLPLSTFFYYPYLNSISQKGCYRPTRLVIAMINIAIEGCVFSG